MALVCGNGSLNIRFYDRDPEKTSLRGTACFGIFCVKIDLGGLGVLAVASCKNPQNGKKLPE